MTYLTPQYDVNVVAASVLVASFASYVSLDLAQRVRTRQGGLDSVWWVAGSVAMGTGIWAMHFVGMLAFSLPIELGYDRLLTLLSWVAAVGAGAVALWIASRDGLTWGRLTAGALTVGGAISCMHYVGMAAMDMAPGIVWNWGLVGLSVLVAVACSSVALFIFSWLRNDRAGLAGKGYQLAAALVMGLAICGMHYTGMAAAAFLPGTVCLSAGDLGGSSQGTLVVVVTLGLQVLILLASMLDGYRQRQADRLAQSLALANASLLAANDELRQRALHDPLTGLPNRQMFEERLVEAIARLPCDPPHRLAVLFIDLDGFKPVNDSLGHATGDLVLQEMAARFRRLAGPGDTVARVGADEFLLLMPGLMDGQEGMVMARALIDAAREPIVAMEQQLEVSASIGMVMYPDQIDADKLVAQADAAMRAVKRAGGGQCAVFEAAMEDGAREQLRLLNDLRHAVRLQQLELHYQPKVDARNGSTCGVEALLRWRHPERGLVPPDVFIPIAERFGLIGSLGGWVIDEACLQLRAWADEQVTMHVAINLSAHQLVDRTLVERIDAALRRCRIDPSRLLCEITESVAMVDIKAAQRTFEGLARIGVYLAIDDFGTGYSSLSYLRQLPARQLKIDRSFVRDVALNADARAIVDAVVRLAHALSLRVVAEGVETQLQCTALRELGCDELQGYLFARPMPAGDVLAWLDRQHEPTVAAIA